MGLGREGVGVRGAGGGGEGGRFIERTGLYGFYYDNLLFWGWRVSGLEVGTMDSCGCGLG